MKRLDTVETLAEAAKRRPVFEPVFRMFSPLLERRAVLPAQLGEAMEKAGCRLPDWDGPLGKQGKPLLSGEGPLWALGVPLQEAARELLPELVRLPALQEHAAALEAFFCDAAAPVLAAESLFGGYGEKLAEQAAEYALPYEVLDFALWAVLGPVLQAAVQRWLPEEGTAPWDAAPSAWAHGWCPICGAQPSIGYLEEKSFDEKNAFASGGGGRKHLHCSLCGTEWHFRRGVCPSCRKEGSGTLELLRQAEDSRGERVEWCTHCKTYSPVVDLRERDARPDMDAQALGMIHLDIVAAQKGLKPLNPSFWNQF